MSRRRRLPWLLLLFYYTTAFITPSRPPISSSWRLYHSLERDEHIRLGQECFERYFDFVLDDWQLQAGGAIVAGFNTIVTAPTGAGKTVVGEMALLHAYHQLQKSGIYTTPLKALSNQKYTDLVPIFGRAHVGLSTGDVSINKGAAITVATTEVYRNIAWRAGEELSSTAVCVLDEFHYMGYPSRGGVWEESVITSPPHVQLVALSATLTNADALAEWMQFVTQRPTVLVAVPNAQRPVPLRYLFATKEGLYPLFRDPDAGPGAPHGLLGLRGDGLVDAASTKSKKKGFGEDESPSNKLPRGLEVNPALRAAAEKRMQRVNRAMERQKVHQRMHRDEDEFGIRRAPPGNRKLSPREEKKERERLLKREMRRAVPSLAAVVQRLEQKDLLPAIFFIFSRAGCEQAARMLYQRMKGPKDPNRLLEDEMEELFGGRPPVPPKRVTRQRGRRRGDLIEDSDGRTFRPSSNYIDEATLDALYGVSDHDEDIERPLDPSPLSSDNWNFYSKAGLLAYHQIEQVAARVTQFNEENSEIAFEDDVIEQYLFGVGCHHAGMLPAHKSFVESLFQNQLMKVVFATETLAAGINMPARTTVVCALAKRGDGSSMNLLETSNLLQMAGRAGRRGKDTDGTCVIVATPFESHEDASRILTDRIAPISSQFRPSYSLAINLIARGEGKLDVARQLVGRSFAMWEKRKAEEKLSEAVDNHGDGVHEVLQISAQEKFMSTLVDLLAVQVETRSAKFNVARLQMLLEILMDREKLKKASKAYVGALKMLELEQTTLGYLREEYRALQTGTIDEELLHEIIAEDAKDLLEQIDLQIQRVTETEKEVNRHPFTKIADIANEIMSVASPESQTLSAALRKAREGDQTAQSLNLSASELSTFAKASVVVRRKTRKLANTNPGLDPQSLLMQSAKAESAERDDTWNDMLAIIKTLVAYGCLTTANEFTYDVELEKELFTLTPAGVNVGMLGLENSLWCLVAMGGAWDVAGASSNLDTFRNAMGDDDTDWYDKSAESPPIALKSQQEAEAIVTQLRQMPPEEVAGYVSCLISENGRGAGASVVEQFQRLEISQQRLIQSALLSMERLYEVQKLYSVDESTRSCTLYVGAFD